MSKCLRCKATIESSAKICPLCNTPIIMENTYDVFPKIDYNYKNHELLYNVIKVCSIIATVICYSAYFYYQMHIAWGII